MLALDNDAAAKIVEASRRRFPEGVAATAEWELFDDAIECYTATGKAA